MRRLTPRQVEILTLTAAGLTRAEIGRKLGLARRTVAFHLECAFVTLGAVNKAQAVSLAHERRLLGGSMVYLPLQPGSARVERETLTPRMREVLALMAEGLTEREIAEKLVIEHCTVSTIVHHIKARLGARTLAQAVDLGWRLGYLPREEGR